MLQRISHGEVLELNIDRPPVNALTPELLREIGEAVAGASRLGARAVAITGRSGMFSAGLDVPHFLNLDEPEARAGFKALFFAMRSIALSSLPVVAGITGHCPAGGAVLSVFCDRRFMAGGAFKFGFNEVEVGLPVPSQVIAMTRLLAGQKVAADLCISGALVESGEALRLGLVDEVLPVDEVVAAALGWCGTRLALPANAFALTRKHVREPVVELFDDDAEDPADAFSEIWFSEETQGAMRALMARLAEAKGGR